MKGGDVSLLAVLLLHMLFIGLVVAEGDLNGISALNTSSHSVDLSGVKNTPAIVKGDGEKKDKDQDGSSQKEITTNALKNMEKNFSEGKDKPLEEPKTFGDLSKESLDEGSNKNKPRTVDSQSARCDPSNRCIDKKTELVACLRVPETDYLMRLSRHTAGPYIHPRITLLSIDCYQTDRQMNILDDRPLANQGSVR